jgi:hypothetical protein
MSYRQFRIPAFASSPHDVSDWVDWMEAERVVHDFLPTPSNACGFCGQPVSIGYDLCQDCDRMRHHIDALVPGTYSLFDGFESLVGTYKNGPYGNEKSTRWQRYPLGTALYRILANHRECFKSALGTDHVSTWVPSDTPSRDFDHLKKITSAVPEYARDYDWDGSVVSRNLDYHRPARKTVFPDAYTVNQDVEGRNVLLFDDLWTTGASMVSVSAALKAAGAQTVVGVVLGRQLRANNSFADAPAIYATVEKRNWNLDVCPLCPGS